MTEMIREENLLTVKADKAIDAENSDELKKQLLKMLGEGIERIVFDLADTEIIDSIGIGLLAATHNSLKSKGNKLELINAKKDICNVLNLMRLDKHFSISCAVE